MTPEVLHRPCVLCGAPTPHRAIMTGGRDREYGAAGEYAYLRCAACGLVRLDPMPTPAEVAALYPPDYHGYQEAASGLTRRLADALLRQRAQSYRRLIGAGGRVLDVGAADGAHFPAWERVGGWRISGIEFNDEAAARGRAAGRDILTADIATSEPPRATFDLVVMNHLLEHVHDPLDVARRAWDALRPGGVLVGEVPNLRSVDAAVSGRYWGGAHWPRHLHQFDPTTLTATLRRAGFTDVRIRPSLHTGHWALSVQNFLQSFRATRSALRSGRAWYYGFLLAAFLPVNLACAAVGRTGIIGFSARKPS